MSTKSPLHVVVNTLSVDRDKAGIRTYLVNMTRALPEAMAGDERLTLIVSEHNEPLFGAALEHPRATAIRLPFDRADHRPLKRIFHDQKTVPAVIHGIPGAVLLNPANVASLRSRIPQVVVVQAPLAVRSIRQEFDDTRSYMSVAQILYYRAIFGPSLRKASATIAVSDFLRGRIIQDFPGLEDRVVTVRYGVDSGHFTPDQELRESDPPFVLFVSTLFPYKRWASLLEAFALARERGLVPDTMSVKIAGKDPDGTQHARARQLIDRLGLSGSAEVLGAVPHADVASLYREATMLAFPSVMETFGLPAVEAMASGLPVIVSNRVSLPEVVGGAGLIVDPDDVEEFAGAIGRVATDRDLRIRMREAGLRRAGDFGWAKAARETMAVIRAAAEDHGVP